MQNEIFGVHYDLRYKGDELSKHIAAKGSDLTEKALTEEIVRTARKAGVTDLYLMDKNFLLSAIREKQERTNPKPLTLDELRGMVGEWVWVVVNYEHDGKPFQCEGWAFVPTPAVIAYLEQMIPTEFCGHKFIAYRHKPEERFEEETRGGQPQ